MGWLQLYGCVGLDVAVEGYWGLDVFVAAEGYWGPGRVCGSGGVLGGPDVSVAAERDGRPAA